jgi:cbb3-type cytochrome oxidase subunit 3
MKIVSQYFESMTGIEIYPLISFMIFFIFFLAVTWYVIRLDRKFIEEVSNYPFARDIEEDNDNLV